MNLNTNYWKEFKLSDLFEIVAGVYHYSDEYEEGLTPYISASNENNGIGQKISLSPDFKGNCIVTGKVGCTAFYQPNDFCATSDVNVFIPKKFKLNEKIGLFIVSIINASENYKWSYGRQCRVGDSKEIIIKLPVIMNKTDYVMDSDCTFSPNGYIPDWQFMEDYIKSLKHKPITTKNVMHNLPTLGTTDWEEFELQEIFDVKYGINMELNACIESEDKDSIIFVARTETNNGVTAKVLPVEGKIPQQQGLITVAGGGSVLSTFLQEKPFYSGRDLYTLKAKENISKYAKLFLITIIKANKYKYNYGRQANKTLPNLLLKLPINELGTPDYIYMENYIKSLPYGDRI